MRNDFPKRPSGAPLHTLSKLYDVPVGFDPPPYFEAEYCSLCGHRRVAVARYRMIGLVLASYKVLFNCLQQLQMRSLKCLRQSEVGWLSCFFDWPENHKLGRGHLNPASC